MKTKLEDLTDLISYGVNICDQFGSTSSLQAQYVKNEVQRASAEALAEYERAPVDFQKMRLRIEALETELKKVRSVKPKKKQ